MLFNMMKSELRFFVRQPSFYVTALIMFLLTFFASISDTVQIGGAANVNVNSPFAIMQIVGIMSVFSIFLVVNFVGSSVIRDEQNKFSELVLSKPINIVQYRLGRFLGAYLVTMLVFSMCLLGVWVGSGVGLIMQWLGPEMLGPNKLAYYLIPLGFLAAPNLFFMASLFVMVAQRFRSMASMYLVAVALLVGYIVSRGLFTDIEYRALAAYLDMFAMSAISTQSEYWTIAERNIATLSLSGELLYNRMIWLGLAALSLLAVVFNQSHYLPQKQKTSSKAKDAGSQSAALANRITFKGNMNNSWAQFLSRTGFEVKQVIFSYSFLVLLLLSLAMLIPSLVSSTGRYGSDVWPVTFRVVEMVQGSFELLIIIVLVYYCAELVWHDREAKMSEIVDSYPVANWVFWGSKYFALVCVIMLLCGFGAVITIVYQLFSGIENIYLSQYLVRLGYLFALPFAILGSFAFLLQVVSPSKYMGMGLFVLYFIASQVMASYGF